MTLSGLALTYFILDKPTNALNTYISIFKIAYVTSISCVKLPHCLSRQVFGSERKKRPLRKEGKVHDENKALVVYYVCVYCE